MVCPRIKQQTIVDHCRMWWLSSDDDRSTRNVWHHRDAIWKPVGMWLEDSSRNYQGRQYKIQHVVYSSTTYVCHNMVYWNSSKQSIEQCVDNNCKHDITAWNLLPTLRWLFNMQIIRLEFVHFDVQFNATCSYDKVRIYDGDNSSTLLGTYCGRMLPGDVISGSNSLFVSFESDRTLTASGFEIKYDAIESNTRE